MACEETAEAFNRQAVSAETQRLAPFAAIKRGVGNLAMGTAHAARATHATHHAGKVHAAHAAHTYVQNRNGLNSIASRQNSGVHRWDVHSEGAE